MVPVAAHAAESVHCEPVKLAAVVLVLVALATVVPLVELAQLVVAVVKLATVLVPVEAVRCEFAHLAVAALLLVQLPKDWSAQRVGKHRVRYLQHLRFELHVRLG